MSVKITIELSDQAAAAAEKLLRTGLWGFTLAEVVVRVFDKFVFSTLIHHEKMKLKRRRQRQPPA